MRTWIAASLGVLGGAAGLLAIEAGLLAQVIGSLRTQTKTADGYKLELILLPSARVGYDQPVAIVLTQAGKPVSNNTIAFTVARHAGTQTIDAITDQNGVAWINLLTFNAQTMTVAAAYTTPKGSVIQDSAHLVFAAKAGCATCKKQASSA